MRYVLIKRVYISTKNESISRLSDADINKHKAN